MSLRWARIALCTLAVSAGTMLAASPAGASTRALSTTPPLTLEAQTPWVGATAPWFNLSLRVGELSIPTRQLRVNVTFYGRINDASELQQALSGTPDMSVLQRVSGLAESATTGERSAALCATVLRESSETPPAAGEGMCGAGSPTVVLGCKPASGRCGDVYPVSVTLTRQGSSAALARITTFLTYEEPQAFQSTVPLRVGWIVPVTQASTASALADALADHHQVPVTMAISPSLASHLAHAGKAGAHTLAQLISLSPAGGDEVLGQPYVPVDLAALEQAGVGSEVAAQVTRGDQLLRQAGLHPTAGTWVDTASNLAAGSTTALASGLATARVHTLVIDDSDLASTPPQRATFAHPFSLAGLNRGDHLVTLAANSTLDSRFTAERADPVLAANQLLAGLSFVHFENAFLTDARGIVLDPPRDWRPATAFVSTLLVGLGTNPALSAVTLDQLLSQVQPGGNGDPTTRKLAAGPASKDGFTKVVAERIALARHHLTSLAGAVSDLSSVMSPLSDALLGTEVQGAGAGRRVSALTSYDHRFARVLSAVSLATERTVTFTARTAPIPITVLSSAPYPVKVVMTVQSDKFSFPGGGSQTLLLNRPTTPVRVQARARTSGDRLPVEVTLRTPDRQLVIARTTLTVHSTALSIVGIALTVLALLVLLVWWGRTWRKGRRRRPRAH